MQRLPIPVHPDPADPDGDRILVEATADGIPVTLLLDSGAAHTSLPGTAELANRASSRTSDGFGASGAPNIQDAVRIDRLVCGPFDRRDLSLGLVDPTGPAPAVLGMDVLGTRCCDFDVSAQVLTVDVPPPEGGLRSMERQSGGQPLVDVRLGDLSVAAVWDTGASLTVVDRTWADRHPGVVFDLAAGEDGQDSTGASVASQVGVLASCEIGRVEFSETRCAVVDLSALNARLASPVHVILGLPVIRQGRWWMDFPHDRWQVRPG